MKMIKRFFSVIIIIATVIHALSLCPQADSQNPKLTADLQNFIDYYVCTVRLSEITAPCDIILTKYFRFY